MLIAFTCLMGFTFFMIGAGIVIDLMNAKRAPNVYRMPDGVGSNLHSNDGSRASVVEAERAFAKNAGEPARPIHAQTNSVVAINLLRHEPYTKPVMAVQQKSRPEQSVGDFQ